MARVYRDNISRAGLYEHFVARVVFHCRPSGGKQEKTQGESHHYLPRILKYRLSRADEQCICDICLGLLCGWPSGRAKH